MNSLRELVEAASTPEELQRIAATLDTPASKWTVRTLAEVAEFFALSTATVRAWRTESPPCPGSEGAWDLSAITAWRHSRLTHSDIATAQKQATLEATQLANDAKRLELAKERGELVELAEVERWAAVALTEAREQMMALPEILATSAPTEHAAFVRSESERHVRDTLASLRRRLDDKDFAEPVADDVTESKA